MKVTWQRRFRLVTGALTASLVVAVLSCLVMAVPTARSTTDAATVSSATGVQVASDTAPLAGLIKPKVTYHGVATYYGSGDGNGACLFGPSDTVMIAAMNHVDYESAKACGAYIRVRASNGRAVTVRITNDCPLPCARGQLDLSPQAFAKLADPKLGLIHITWKLLSLRTSRTIAVRYKDGSSRWWCGIQVIDHRNPVARLELRVGGRWRKVHRTGFNYFIPAKGAGCGGPIRITDIYGQRLTVRGIKIKPDVIQRTKVQFLRH
jgi:expansin (peptidoglycan-binding protein)